MTPLSKERKNAILLGVILALVLLSVLLFLWYKGYFTALTSVETPTAQKESTKVFDVLNDPRFQKLKIDSEKPLNIGSVGNPNPFQPFDDIPPEVPDSSL